MTENPTKILLPALKAGLEAVEIEHEGKPMILLRDQEGLIEGPIVVSPGAFFLSMLLDGKNDMADLQRHYTQATGAILTIQEVQSFLNQFDTMQLLETPQLQEKRIKTWQDFLNSPTRPAQMAGKAYPKDPLELAVMLGKYFKDPKGPGKELASSAVKGSSLVGLVSPHIDFERGGPLYAWSYQALSECPRPDVIVAIGVAH